MGCIFYSVIYYQYHARNFCGSYIGQEKETLSVVFACALGSPCVSYVTPGSWYWQGLSGYIVDDAVAVLTCRTVNEILDSN